MLNIIPYDNDQLDYRAFAGESSLFPPPGSMEEQREFSRLSKYLLDQYDTVFPNPRLPRTVVVVPSLTFDSEILSKVTGAHHYEERMLCMLMLLRMPRTHLIFVTSQPINPIIIDYYLHLLPGIPGSHARDRLTLISCYDSSPNPLTYKILQRPRLMARLRKAIGTEHAAHISCFNATSLERTLSVRLGIPLYACDPSHAYLGSKSGSRMIFKQAGVEVPEGYEDLRDVKDLADGLYQLKRRAPHLRKAVIKLNEGFSGEGNAVFSFNGLPSGADLRKKLPVALPERSRIVAPDLRWEEFEQKFQQMGGIVESFIEGETIASPSVQGRVTPKGKCQIISTHDQILGGESAQVFKGARFPAHPDYHQEIGEIGYRVGEVLSTQGAMGRFGVDFMSVKEDDGWHHYAIEINLRKGGTTHPYMMLQFLTDGQYDRKKGLYEMQNGQTRYYFASDNLRNQRYVGLLPTDLMDMTVYHGLHYDGATQQGVVFHLIGALSEFGKLGVLCIGDSPEKAESLYQKTVSVLDFETGAMEDGVGNGVLTV